MYRIIEVSTHSIKKFIVRVPFERKDCVVGRATIPTELVWAQTMRYIKSPHQLIISRYERGMIAIAGIVQTKHVRMILQTQRPTFAEGIALDATVPLERALADMFHNSANIRVMEPSIVPFVLEHRKIRNILALKLKADYKKQFWWW